ncbi:uncharacterized protein LOC129257866 [Lytechinus pictus]|uniref:uncharacterized protein LOC129257866 n=1 Tax=Lytechinus pictus TaxID=7653 RepID=UPI00240CEAF0|nr:uncharacterized protein LOC129257866 [Lytechinus pictus]XP_054752269.1 uncharacterized protein LOC129257866 [Lytechinus pictus]
MERNGPGAPQIPARPTIFQHAESLLFFHGRLTNTEEDRIFKYYLDTRGAFLLRKSNSQEDTIVISIVVDRKNIFHIKVEQRHGKVCIFQSDDVFSSLARLIEYYQRHPFPGTKHQGLYLTKAINANRFTPATAGTPAPGERAPPLSSLPKEPSIDERPPMPLPSSQNPIYAEYRHLYSRVDKVESDQLGRILQLCEEVDKEILNVGRMKCSCGLYKEESELIDGWMMHRDTEGEATRGRIFFLDTKTNQSTWKLPQEVEMEIRKNHPDKWRMLCRLLKEPVANYDF